MKHQDLISQMTLEEKASFCSGADYWHFKGLDRLGLESIMVSDGPHGLRKQGAEDSVANINASRPATAFPTAVTTACSWDPDLIYEMGQALGEECLQEEVSILLGPGCNMKRSPLCGRNFEYFSEDPFLAGNIAAGYINGVQSKGVGVSFKHFAVNSQETRRMIIDAVADERTLREIFLPAFEIGVKKAQPWTVMSAYNRLNGDFCSENDWLLNKVLKKDWGHEGIVITDWGAEGDIVEGIRNGQEVEMPSSHGINEAKLVKAVQEGRLDESILDERVDRIVDIILKAQETRKKNQGYKYSIEGHNELARKIATQSMVLLKNENNMLPLSKDKKYAVVGEMAMAPRYQGAGSSAVNPTVQDNAFDALKEAGMNVEYAKGYEKSNCNTLDEKLLNEAKDLAKNSDAVIVFIGLTEKYESEGVDRKHLDLPTSHNEFVEEIAKVNENVIVVLAGGAPVLMPWLPKAKALLNSYLGGQASGHAVSDLLTGAVNPSGKLAETYPLSLEDTPCYNYYPGNPATVEHRESVYVGYRYYDTADKKVLFPFGYGLSYTTFEYSDIKLSDTKIKDTDKLTVSFKVKNTGKVDGAEVCELYVTDNESTIYRPSQELKGFKKVFLKAGEEKTVEIELEKRAFAYYNVNISDWHVESGEFTIIVASSSRDAANKLTATVEVETTQDKAIVPDYSTTAPSYYGANIQNLPDEQFKAVLGRDIPPIKRDPNLPFDINSNFEDAKDSKWGKKIYKFMVWVAGLIGNDDNVEMITNAIVQMSMRGLVNMSQGIFSEKSASGMI
nr:glycoside hydrolase family 3 C-terminal domain-containing protein [Clostridiales bacterium]